MKKVLSIILVLLMLLAVGYYIFDVVYNETPIKENLFRMLAVLCGLIASMIRINRGGGGRRRLDFYEKSYQEEIGTAFAEKQFLRTKLLCATRLYDERNYRKALKYLNQLLPVCESKDDYCAVLLFMALCYSDMGLSAYAIKAYNRLLEMNPEHVNANSNIGIEYIHKGDYETAIYYFEQAIALDPGYAEAYNNLAVCYFRMHELYEAIPYAEQALELKRSLYSASGLLATIYALLGEDNLKEKYFHLAVSTGKDSAELLASIQHFMAEKAEFLDSDEEEDENEPEDETV